MIGPVIPVPNHPGVHLEVSRALPLNSSLNTRRQFPVWPTGCRPEGVAVGELELAVDVMVGEAVLVLVGAAALVLVGSAVFVLVGAGGL